MFENLFTGQPATTKKKSADMFAGLFDDKPIAKQGGGMFDGLFSDRKKNIENEKKNPQSVWRNMPVANDWRNTQPMSIAKPQERPKKNLLQAAVSGITNLGNMATNEIIDWLQINKQKLEKSIFDRDLEAELYKRYLQKEKLSPQGEKIAKEYDKKQKEYLMNAAIGATEPMKIGLSLIKKLTTVASKERAFKLLKEANVADDIAREYAPIVAKTTKEPAMFDVIKAIEKAQNTTKATKAVGSFDTLATEARKYKTAEEFVKAQGTNKLYHVSDNPNLKLSKDYQPKQGQLGKGLYVTKDPEIWQGGQIGKRPYVYEIDANNLKIANDYPTRSELIDWGSKNGYYKKDFLKKPNGEYVLGQDGNPMKVWQETPKAEKLMDYKDPMTGSKMSGLEQEYLKSKGYDGVSASYSPDGEQSLIFNYDKIKINPIKTKSQLTDIWNKANKKITLEQVAKESTEYPNAGNFAYVANKKYGIASSKANEIWKQANKKSATIAGDFSGELKSTTGKITEIKPQQIKPQISNKLSQEKLFVPLKETTTATQKSQDPVQIVIQALKEAKPIRVKQEAIYSAQRSQQTARIVAMGKKVSGEQGYFAQLGQLKGKMQVAQFEGIRSKITQPVVDNLFDTIEKSTVLTPFDKISAKTGLSRLLGAEGGIVPTKGELKLLNEVFPPEFIKNILEKRPLMQKLWGVAENLLNLPRSMMATLDLSAPLRQGVFLIGRPKQFLPAFKSMFKYVASEKSYLGLMDSIKARPTYKLMRESGLSLTEMGTDLLSREEAFMSNLSEKMPGFGSLAKASNRAYSGFLNKLRADVFDDLVKRAKILDIIDNEKVTKDIAKFVNSATGRGDIGVLSRASTIMNGLFFSPRLMASRLNLLNPAYYISLNPMVRKEAIKSLLSFGAVASTVLGLTKLNDEVSVGADPRSADFGKIKIGNTRFDVLGGFQQYMVLISRLISGQMVSSTTGKEFTLGEGYKPTTRGDIIQRFFQSKTSPVASFIIGLVNGQSTMGENFKISAEIADRFIPMMIQDMYDLYRENGADGLLMAFPGVFGIGSQTYMDQIPLETKTATGKPTIEWRSQPSLGETIINKITGTKIKSVPVKETYDKVQQLLRDGKINEARNIVNGLSENEYALYKKFKEKDKRIANDELKAKIIPVYNDVKKLKEQNRIEEAKKIVNSLTDKEYEIYKKIKEEDYQSISD